MNSTNASGVVVKASRAEGWRESASGVAAVEFALVFPILLMMLLAVYEIGTAIMLNLNTIAASQTIVDLITRNDDATDDIIDEAVAAGQLAMGSGIPVADIGIDIISVSFDEDDEPQEEWRVTQNIADPDETLVQQAAGLGTYGDGVVLVLVTYTYSPTFGNQVVGDIHMAETAFARGRNVAVVTKSDI